MVNGRLIIVWAGPQHFVMIRTTINIIIKLLGCDFLSHTVVDGCEQPCAITNNNDARTLLHSIVCDAILAESGTCRNSGELQRTVGNRRKPGQWPDRLRFKKQIP